jgi:predicted nucleic-acid-binding protein
VSLKIISSILSYNFGLQFFIMGQIIIDLPSRIKRHYRLENEESAAAILAQLEENAFVVKSNPAQLTAQDEADIRAARAAKEEYLRTGESYSVDELRAEFNV